jgi:DNA-directed RNA polymerase specialized sigma24 family protein
MDLPATRYSVLAAVRSDDAGVRRGGFESLVAVYWKPVYKYLRVKWRFASDEAADATQEFFARAIEKHFFDGYDSTKARFRTFLRVCLDRFVTNERKAAGRLKRGGGETIVPLDFETAEGELRRHDVGVPPDVEDYFHHEWVRSLLALAVDDVRAEYERAGKSVQFAVFERYDLDAAAGETPTYASIASELGLSVFDVTNYLAAARRTFRRRLLDRLRAICGGSEEFEAEARHLLRGGLR